MNPLNPTTEPDLASELLEGRYKLEEVIGKGGVGVVMRARQVSVDRPVAIKMLHAQHQDNQEALARFELEARALGRLTHPGCLTLFDFGYSEQLSSYFMVTEFVTGETLEHHLKTQSLPVSQYLDAVADTCMALAHSHGHGILHRDLKPSNIMLLSDGPVGVKVLDFGLARLYEETLGAQRLSMTGHVYGTPAYMSPEQCRGESEITPATDVYSLGIILYEIFEGKTPFEASNITGVLLKHIGEECPEMTSELAQRDIKQLITTMVAKEPKDRPSDLVELANTIRQWSDRLRDVRRASTLMQYRRATPTPIPDTELELPQLGPVKTQLVNKFDETLGHTPAPPLLARSAEDGSPPALTAAQDLPHAPAKRSAMVAGIAVLLLGGLGLWAGSSKGADTSISTIAEQRAPAASIASNAPTKIQPVVYIQPTEPEPHVVQVKAPQRTLASKTTKPSAPKSQRLPERSAPSLRARQVSLDVPAKPRRRAKTIKLDLN